MFSVGAAAPPLPFAATSQCGPASGWGGGFTRSPGRPHDTGGAVFPALAESSHVGTTPGTEAGASPCPPGKSDLPFRSGEGCACAWGGRAECPPLSMHTDVFEVSLGFCGNFAFLVLLLVSLVTSKTNTHSCVTGSPSDFSDRLLGLGTRQNVGSRNPNRASPLQSRLPAPRTKGHGALLRPGRPGPGPSGATSGQAFLLTTLAMFVEEHQAHSVCLPSACHPEPLTAGTGGACPVLRVPVSGNHRTWVLTTHRSLTPFASS